jgi:U6 snRNA-associated Sm-like protein LSm8
MSLLEELLEQNVSVVTNDGRNVVGHFYGVDQMTNVILLDCHERVYDRSGTQKVPLGLYVIRGDNIAVLGLIDEEVDAEIDFQRICAEPLKPITH